MALIQDQSVPSIRGEASVFQLPPTDTTVDYSAYCEHKPVINVQDSTSKIEFLVHTAPSQYLDLLDSFLYVKVKAVKKDGSDFAATDNFSTVNNFLHSLFSQVDLYINNKLISSDNCYPYKAIIQNYLNYSYNFANSQGAMSLYIKDTNRGSLTDTNSGYKKRKAYVSGSTEVEMIDKLRFDLSNQSRFILSDTSINIFLTRSTDEFVFLSPDPLSGDNPSPKVKIVDISFFVRKHSLFPSIILAHHKMLNSGKTAKYPYVKTNCKFYTIAKGSQSFIQDNIFSSSIPLRIVLCLVKNSSFIGSHKENPFIFQPFNLSYLSLSVNNLPIPIRPISYDFSNNNYLLGYFLLYSSIGKNSQDFSLAFTREEYGESFTLFAFDINPLIHDDPTLYLEKNGTCSIEIKFSTALSDAVSLLLYSETQGLLEFDKYRQVTVQ